MKIKNIFELFVAVAICEAAGAAGTIWTAPAILSGWYASLAKPSFNPPAWIFGPVWTLLFALMGVSLWLAWKNDWQVQNHILEKERKSWNRFSRRLWTGSWQKANVIAIFAVQLLLNVLWTAIFFGFHAPGLAFFEILALWCAIVYLCVNFYRISKTAAWLLAPYLLWVSFAAVLNYFIWALN